MSQTQSHPKISIIIPVYNVVRYVKSCIQSILDQSFTDYEAIIVNDGSTDDSMVIVQSLIKDDQRFRIINPVNAGLGPARNTGITATKGDYIAFVDSDDTVHKDYLLCLYQTITQYQADMCYCDFNISYIDRPGTIFNSTHLPLPSGQTHWQTAMRLFLNGKLYLAAWQKLYRRHLFSDIRFPSGYVEDVAINLVLLLKQPVITYCPKPLYNYNRRSDSLSTSITEQKLIDGFERLKEIKTLLDEHQLLDQYQDDFYFYYLIHVNGLLSSGLIKNNQVNHNQIIQKACMLVDPQILNTQTLTTLIYKKRLYLKPYLLIRHLVGLYLITLSSRLWSVYKIYYRVLYRLHEPVKKILNNLKLPH